MKLVWLSFTRTSNSIYLSGSATPYTFCRSAIQKACVSAFHRRGPSSRQQILLRPFSSPFPSWDAPSCVVNCKNMEYIEVLYRTASFSSIVKDQILWILRHFWHDRCLQSRDTPFMRPQMYLSGQISEIPMFLRHSRFQWSFSAFLRNAEVHPDKGKAGQQH